MCAEQMLHFIIRIAWCRGVKLTMTHFPCRFLISTFAGAAMMSYSLFVYPKLIVLIKLSCEAIAG